MNSPSPAPALGEVGVTVGNSSAGMSHGTVRRGNRPREGGRGHPPLPSYIVPDLSVQSTRYLDSAGDQREDEVPRDIPRLAGERRAKPTN